MNSNEIFDNVRAEYISKNTSLLQPMHQVLHVFADKTLQEKFTN